MNDTPHALQWAIDGKLPGWFWDQTPTLKRIQIAAGLRKTSPDAVLHSVLVRIAALLPPDIRVDAGRGPTSLNYFAIGAAPSGYGKSVAWDIGTELVSHDAWQIPDFHGELPIGSGEGCVEVFMGEEATETGAMTKGRNPEPEVKTTRAQTKHNALFYVDEGETLEVLLARQGATLGTVLRAAWNGGTLGQTNATAERTRYARAGTYSMGLMISWQPTKMAPLFSSTTGGTPQRFMFCPAVNPDAPTGVRRGFIRPIEGLAQHVLNLPDQDRVLELPMSAMEESEAWHDARNRGVPIDELDGHMMLHRAKAAALLALLDMEAKISADHWDLAREMWEASHRMRSIIIGMVTDAAVAERVRSGTERAEVLEATTGALESARVRATAVEVARRLALTPNKQLFNTTNGMWMRLAYRKWRKDVDPALVVEYGVEHGLFVDFRFQTTDGVTPAVYLAAR